MKKDIAGKNNPNYKHGGTLKKYYCLDCNKKISYNSALYGTNRCKKCAYKHTIYPSRKGKNNSQYKGQITHEGYVYIYMPEHPGNKWQNKYIKKATLVMEKYLGRHLLLGEIIHHKNSIRNDDSLENLELFQNQKEHKKRENQKRNLKTGKFIKNKKEVIYDIQSSLS